MKKPTIDRAQDPRDQFSSIKENIEILTGVRGGAIARSKGIPTPSVGVDVASAGPSQVTLKTEHDQLILFCRDLEAKFNALVSRMNTP